MSNVERDNLNPRASHDHTVPSQTRSKRRSAEMCIRSFHSFNATAQTRKDDSWKFWFLYDPFSIFSTPKGYTAVTRCGVLTNHTCLLRHGSVLHSRLTIHQSPVMIHQRWFDSARVLAAHRRPKMPSTHDYVTCFKRWDCSRVPGVNIARRIGSTLAADSHTRTARTA